MKIYAASFLTVIALAAAQTALSSGQIGIGPNGSWAAAESAIESVDTRNAQEDLRRMALAGQDEALLEGIDWIARRPDWPAAAREYTLFTFTGSLADLAPGTVDERILRYLASIRPTVRIPHPDDDRLGMVLFNIPAAARGVATEWRRRDATRIAVNALSRGADAWIGGYLAGDRIEREGYLASLDGAVPLDDLAEAVERRMDANPGLAPALARIGIVLVDERRFARAFGSGRVPGAARLARAAGAAFDSGQALRALDGLAATAPPSNTAAVLAELAPLLARSPEGTRRLFELVEDDSLGLAAAIALARHGDGAARRRLESIAGTGTDDASRHAAIALHAQHPGGSRP